MKKKAGKMKWPRRVSKQKSEDLEISLLIEKRKQADSFNVATFSDFPLSEKTKKGLREHNYNVPTEIQRESIGLSLQGRDILGAAETGSGKTLAFLIPVLEGLYARKWASFDGVGAMIITPTRELAYQIFETLKKVGQFHDFSAGLIIGGKDLKFEKHRMDQCNIVICTPGRILHHMDFNPLFDCSHLKILVLDEADRCLDMGFEKEMNNIIDNLPSTRQTLLFSATQTKSVKDLARLSLKTPCYVSVHENKKHTTPDALEQSYIVCNLEEKINFLWSFIKNHRRQKILVFLSSCKQVKYITSVFCRLRAGTPLLALYGTLHQLRRMRIYNDFCSKQNVVMLATDIAARGLDFPEVNWVVQMDSPEDATTYIHRAGRTARYSKGGESLLVLLPSEEKAMLAELELKRVPISKIEVNTTKLMSPVKKIEELLARDPELKADAQRCFLSYIKSVHLMRNKDIFNVQALDVGKFAASLGLAVVPKIRFLKGQSKNQLNTMNTVKAEKIQGNDDLSDEFGANTDSIKPGNGAFHSESDAEDDGFLTLKRRNHALPDDISHLEDLSPRLSKKQQKKIVITKAAVAKKILKKNIVANKHTLFTDDGDFIEQKGKEKFTEEARAYENENTPGIDLEKARLVLRAEDKFDKKLYRERLKLKRLEQKKKLKEKNRSKEEVEMRLEDGSSDEENDSEPDTSWIPDPDKFKKNNDEDDISGELHVKEDCYGDGSSQGGNASSPDSEIVERRPSKRKEKNIKRTNKKRRLAEDECAAFNTGLTLEEDECAPFSTGLTLEEDEEVALRILQSFK